MSFQYSVEWKDEVVKLASLETGSREQDARLTNLIIMADSSNDKRVIQTLMRALIMGDAYIDETFLGTLSTIDFSVYYTALFETKSEFLHNPDYRDWAVGLLGREHLRIDYTNEHFAIFSDLAKRNLDQQDLRGYLLAYEESANFVGGSLEETPYPEFKRIFEKLLKEKSEK